ncbi:MAG: S49 family peptidase, partial [Myxococcota bacterium]|nr:S49 family peptidase [Myxococcota bacterium]
ARSVELLGREKPTVSFFSSVAASGGYYLSAVSHEIIALPGSITGSIGVVGGKLVVEKAARDWGIHSEVMQAGPDADFFSPMSPFSDSQRDRFRSFLAVTYERFLQIVSGGRGMPVSAVEKVAGGRVWTGRQALEHNLVDQMGDLNYAIQRVALKANISRYRLIHIRKRPTFWERLQQNVGAASLWERKIPDSIQLLQSYPMQPLTYLEEGEDYSP